MCNLDFPIDCIEDVNVVYQDANFLVPGDKQGTITIERGPIQGESLSPLPFLVFIKYSLAYTNGIYASTSRFNFPQPQANNLRPFGDGEGA